MNVIYFYSIATFCCFVVFIIVMVVIAFAIIRRGGKVPSPFASVVKQENVEYLNQLLLYDLVHMSWHSSSQSINKSSAVIPAPRYGIITTTTATTTQCLFEINILVFARYTV